ncbi:Immunoglobulin-binding protein 1 [Dirofilaria immitis]|nr:Immunoglobulin-binding protein 1 [Dirofilaria immitis]
MMNDIERNDISLRHEFEFCENIIRQLESGKQSTKDLQDQLKQCEEKLKFLTKEVSARSLFSNNENVDELPTSSLNYLFLPYYLAMVTQNIIVGPERRLSSLDCAKDVDLSKRRELKLRRFQQEKELTELVRNSESELHSNTDDDGLMRELIINRLRLAAMKSVDEMKQIDQERPMAEHMLKIQTGQNEALPKRPMKQFAQTPFIITRDDVQKKVFGLGYPSIPTMTVNEWYDDMMKNGRFGTTNPSSSENNPDSNDMSGETWEEQEQARLQRWDDYKDYHRRGWGNMHNKG